MTAISRFGYVQVIMPNRNGLVLPPKRIWGLTAKNYDGTAIITIVCSL